MATYVLAQNWTMRIFTFESHVYMACTQIYGRLRVHNVYSSLRCGMFRRCTVRMDAACMILAIFAYCCTYVALRMYGKPP